MKFEALANDFWRDGYLVLEDVFDPELMDEYQRLIIGHFGENPEFAHNEEFLTKAATDVIPWFPQQDGFDVFDRVENDQCLLNRLIYTEDLGPKIGGQTVVVPGTHRRGELTVGPVNEDLPGQLTLTPRKGTLVLLHGHTWHRVLPVRGRYRVSTNYRCCPRGTPANITDICVYRNMRYRFETNEVVEDRLATSI